MKNIPFFRPSVDKEELNNIEKCLNDISINYVEKLEENFSKYIGCDYSIAVSNVANAFHLIMSVIELKRGDKFIVSTDTFVTIPEAIRHFDAEPIFVDINKDNFTIDIEAVKSVLKKNKTKKLRGIILTHIAGRAVNLDEFYELAKENKLLLIEDATSALGARYKNKRVGSLEADATIFSFNPTHNKLIPSEAGVIATNDVEISEKAKLLRTHGLETEFDKFGNISYVYDVHSIGHKYDLNNINAAYAIAQLEKNDNFIKKRVSIAKEYNDAFKSAKHIKPPQFHNEHTFSQYIIKIDKNRDAFARELKEYGISTGLHYVPLYLLSYYKQKYKFKVTSFLNALEVYQQVLSLPIYPDMTQAEIKYVIECVNKIDKNWI